MIKNIMDQKGEASIRTKASENVMKARPGPDPSYKTIQEYQLLPNSLEKTSIQLSLCNCHRKFLYKYANPLGKQIS